MPLGPQDDRRHDLSRSAHGRESLYWVMPLPDEELLLLVYAWVNADGSAGRFVVVGGPDADAPLVFDSADKVAFEGSDLDACTIGGLSLAIPEPLQRSELKYSSDKIELDIGFDAIHAAFSYADNRDGCPAWLADDRFEQSITARGRLNVDGREIAIDTTAHRDHSWGTRDWEMLHQWQWFNIQKGAEETLNAYTNVILGERTVNGYLYRDGRVSPLVEVDHATHFDPDYLHHDTTLRVLDEDGREATVTAQRNAAFKLDFAGAVMVNEVSGPGDWDGVRVPVLHEIGWDPDYIVPLMRRNDA